MMSRRARRRWRRSRGVGGGRRPNDGAGADRGGSAANARGGQAMTAGLIPRRAPIDVRNNWRGRPMRCIFVALLLTPVAAYPASAQLLEVLAGAKFCRT